MSFSSLCSSTIQGTWSPCSFLPSVPLPYHFIVSDLLIQKQNPKAWLQATSMTYYKYQAIQFYTNTDMYLGT